MSRSNSLAAFVLIFLGPAVLQTNLNAQESLSSNPDVLIWKWNEGDKLGMQITQEVFTNSDDSNEPEQPSNVTRTWLTWEVTHADAHGIGTIKSVVDRITMEARGPQGTIQYDSNVETDDPQVLAMARNVKPMVGARTTQQINKLGEVLMVRVGVELEAKLSEIGGEAYVRTFKDISRNATLVLPNKSLAVDDTWEKEVETPSPLGKVRLTSTYTYAGEEQVNDRQLHMFDVHAKIRIKSASVVVEEQDTRGKIYFDAQLGRIDHSEVEQNIVISILQKDQKATQSIRQRTRVRISPK